MNGSGEEHVIYSDGRDVKRTFTIDRHNDAMSITPQFDALFPELERAKYFLQVFDYMFANQPQPLPGGQVLQLLTSTPEINWGRYFGDAVIALAAFGACVGSGAIGCALARATAAAGADFWTNTVPAVTGPDGNSLTDEFLKAWLIGLCGGVSATFDVVTGQTPQIGCR
jgi:hypothetical protein